MNKVKHPDFRCVLEGCYVKNGATHVAVFDRPEWKTPSPEQIAEYERKRVIVEANDGRMRYRLDAGRNDAFTTTECSEMRDAVERDLSGWEIVGCWNGEGHFTYSVSIRRRT